MVGSSFFRTDDDKCPNCGSFGVNEEQEDGLVCPSCDAVFNRYIILQQGDDVEFRNN